MSLNVIILLCFIGLSHSAVMIYQVKEGGQVILDLGPNVVIWGRQRNNGNEYIKYCKAEDKKTWCKRFVGEDDKPALPESNALVAPNGTLIINSFQATDVGDYFSPDELERIHFNSDGTYWSTPRSRISVVLE